MISQQLGEVAPATLTGRVSPSARTGLVAPSALTAVAVGLLFPSGGALPSPSMGPGGILPVGEQGEA